MATCQELNANQQSDNGGSSHADSERICGTGKIVHVGDGSGIIRSLNKDMIYFREKKYLPPTKGICQVLKKKDFLCFVAKPSQFNKRIKWTAVSVWRPGYEPGCQVKPNQSEPGSQVKPKQTEPGCQVKLKQSEADGVEQAEELVVEQGTEEEAFRFLTSILEPDLMLHIDNLPAFVCQESPDVQRIFLHEQNMLAFLGRHRSVFFYGRADKNVMLMDEKVRKTIRFITDVLEERGRLDLESLRMAVSDHRDQTIATYGRKIAQFRSFVRRFTDVFKCTKDDDQWFVDLRPNPFCDFYERESLVSSVSETTFDSADFRPLSTASSMFSSVSPGSSLHASTSDLACALPPKSQGISKMLNALLKREPMPVKNLIGYIHTSPPEIRQAIGNTMEKLTNFLQSDENFFLQKPENLVFMRCTVEKRALRYLSELIGNSKGREVKLDDVPKFQGKHAFPEVRAFLGRTASEVSSAVQQMMVKEELRSEWFLVLRDNLLSIGYSSQGFHSETNDSSAQHLSESNNRPSTSFTDHNKDLLSEVVPGPSACKKLVSDLDTSENEAVDFLRNLLERDEVLTIGNIKQYLWDASAEVCEMLLDEHLIIAFLKRHPSVFNMSGPLNVIELCDDAVQDAIAFCFNVLNMKGDLPLKSLCGHMSSASPRIRSVTGGAVPKLEAFLRKYFDVFRVYEGKHGLTASSKLKKKTSRRQSTAVTEVLKDSVGGRLSALAFSDMPKTELTTEGLGGVNRCFETARAVNDLQNGPAVHHALEKPDSKVKTARTSAGLDFLASLLKIRSAMVLTDIVQYVSQASEIIQEELGCSEQEILSFVEENPAVFKISGSEFSVELISETCGDAIEFYLDVLNRRGPTSVSKLHGHLSQASLAIRNATGGSPESVKTFLLQFPNVFKLIKANGIEMIASLYEGECVSESSDAGVNEKPDTSVSEVNANKDSKSIESRETTSIYGPNADDPDFDFALTLSERERSSKAITTTALSTLDELDLDFLPNISEKSLDNGTEFNRLDQLDLDYILSMSKANQCRGAETRGDARVKLDKIEDSDESTSSYRASRNCESTPAEIKADFLTEAEVSNRAVRLDIATETHPPNLSGSLRSASKVLSNPQNADVPSLVTCAKDEYNVMSDLCAQALSNNYSRAIDITELLTICQKADPLHSGWQRTLHLAHLDDVLRKDDRFFVNESNGSVMLIRDVEYAAAAFLRQCILFYEPMVLEKLSSYNYLTFAATEVRVLLGASGKDSTQFRKKSIKLLWPKFRDQLFVQNGVLVVSQDAESDALAFLSNLIETYGPLRLDSLPGYLLQASIPVNKFLKKKLDNIEDYLLSGLLDRHFIVWNGVVDLVRSGNLQKNRLIVEQTLAAFLVNEIHLHGPIFWNHAIEQLDLWKATPDVREFLGGQWNATTIKVGQLKKFCKERPDLFICTLQNHPSDGVRLLADNGGQRSGFLDDQSDHISDACPALTRKGEKLKDTSTEQKAVHFLKDIIERQGPIGCKKKQLNKRFDLMDAPSDVRTLLGGQKDAVRFLKTNLMVFFLRHPTVFTTYKHRVDLNRSVCQPQPSTVVGQSQPILYSSVVAWQPSEPPLSLPSHPLACSDFPAATIHLPATSATVPSTASTVNTWPSFAASFTNMSCAELNQGSRISVAASPLCQIARFQLRSKAPVAQSSCEPSLGLPLNLDLPAPSVQHSLKHPGFEALPQIALCPGGTFSPIEDSLSSASQGGMTSYAPSALASHPTILSVDPISDISSVQSIPVLPMAGFASVCVEPAINAPLIDTLYTYHTEPHSFCAPLLLHSAQVLQNTQPLISTSTQSVENALAQPLYGSLESAMLDATVMHGVMEIMAAEGETLEKTGESQEAKDLEDPKEPRKRDSPEDVEELNKMKSQEGVEESPIVISLAQDFTVKHGVIKAIASEGETLEETEDSDKAKDLEESRKWDSPEDDEESNKMESQEGLEESCIVISLAQDSTVKHGVIKAVASEGETLEKTGESEEVIDLEELKEPRRGDNLEDVELNKMESHEGLEESLKAMSLARVQDTESKEGTLLLKMPQMIETSEKSEGFSEAITHDIQIDNDAKTELIQNSSCTLKCHGTLSTNDATVLTPSTDVLFSLLNETEGTETEAGASSPCVESPLKSLKVSSSLPVTWKSMVQSADLPDFNEQFGCFDGISEYLSFLDGNTRREDISATSEYSIGASETDEDLYETAESDADGEGQDFEEVIGTVLSAVGNQVYVRREDDRVVQFTSGNCTKHFRQCCHLGRHFAIGESVSLRYRRCPHELVSACSVHATAGDDGVACCSNFHINLGHGRVTLTGENYVVFMTSNHEMVGFITVNPHLFSPNDLIHFWSTKVSGFMTPWQAHSVVFTNEDGVTMALDNDPHSTVYRIPHESSPWRLTTDVGCQTDLTCSAVQTLSDSSPGICHQQAQTVSTGRVMSFGCYLEK